MDEFVEETFDGVDEDFDPIEAQNIDIPSDSEDEDNKWNLDGDISICTEDGNSFRVGDKWNRPGVCELRICNKGGIISVMRCPTYLYGKEKVQSGECVVKEENTNRDFPKCCEMIYCGLTEQEREKLKKENSEPK